MILDDNKLRELMARPDFQAAFPFLLKQSVPTRRCCRKKQKPRTVTPDLQSVRNAIAAFSQPQLAKLKALTGAPELVIHSVRMVRGKRVQHKLVLK